MQLIKPIEILNSHILSSTAVETVPEWVSGTSYPLEAEVQYLNVVYVSTIPSNSNKVPNVPVTPLAWKKKQSNNKFSMFDEYVNTQTIANGSLTLEIQTGYLSNSLALLNLEGVTDALIKVKDGVGGTEVFNKTYNLDDTIILDWYQYFFEDVRLQDELIIQELPPYLNGVVSVTLNGIGDIAVGNLVLGNIYFIGNTQEGASAGIRDYSSKAVNEYGITQLKKKAFSKRMDVNLFVNNTELNFVRRILQDIRATPVVWIGTPYSEYAALNIYGYYKDFNLEIPYPSFSFCRLEIEGMI